MASWDGTQEIQLTSYARRRVAPALEPGQQIPVVRVVATGGERRPAVADEPRRRRSDQGQRRQGRRLRLRVGPRRQARSSSSSASRIRATRKTMTTRRQPKRRRRRRRSSSIATSSSRTSTATCATRARISTSSTSRRRRPRRLPAARNTTSRRPPGPRTAPGSRSSASAVTGDLDRHDNTDVWVIDAKAGAQPRQLTTSPTSDEGPLAVEPRRQADRLPRGEELKYSAYNQNTLAVIPGGRRAAAVAGAVARSAGPRAAVVRRTARRSFVGRRRSRRSIPARVDLDATDGPSACVTDKSVITAPSAGSRRRARGAGGERHRTAGGCARPGRGGKLRRALAPERRVAVEGVRSATTEEFTSISKDGTEVHGLIVKPPTLPARGRSTRRCCGSTADRTGRTSTPSASSASSSPPTAMSWWPSNYRGSNGRGSAFQKAIFADWGGKEVVDLLGAMDHVQKLGLADPDRLGIGGWSYGGILTDYTIATDGRFKAATSGAGSALQLSMYGVDQYITQYEQEIGPPWKSPGSVDEDLVSVLPRGSDQDADAVSRRREGLQRADRGQRADVPGAQEPGRRHAARDLPGAVPRHHDRRPTRSIGSSATWIGTTNT